MLRCSFLYKTYLNATNAILDLKNFSVGVKKIQSSFRNRTQITKVYFLTSEKSPRACVCAFPCAAMLSNRETFGVLFNLNILQF